MVVQILSLNSQMASTNGAIPIIVKIAMRQETPMVVKLHNPFIFPPRITHRN